MKLGNCQAKWPLDFERIMFKQSPTAVCSWPNDHMVSYMVKFLCKTQLTHLKNKVIYFQVRVFVLWWIFQGLRKYKIGIIKSLLILMPIATSRDFPAEIGNIPRKYCVNRQVDRLADVSMNFKILIDIDLTSNKSCL